MKYLLLSCFLLCQLVVKAQVLHTYKDTVTNFHIGMPEKWKYQAYPDSPAVKLIVSDMDNAADKPAPDNFLVTIFPDPGSTVDSAFYLLHSITGGNRLQDIDTGSYRVDGERMLWFEDVHIGETVDDTLCGSYFVMYRKETVYVLTCITSPARFKGSRELFHRIAQTFKISFPPKKEVLILTLPEVEKWREVSEDNNSSSGHYIRQLLPAGQTIDEWNSLITVLTTRLANKLDIETLLEIDEDEAKSENKDAGYTVLSKGNDWILSKVEVTGLQPETIIQYTLHRSYWLHLVNITFRQSPLPADVVEKWSRTFRAGRLVME